jgi:hypothetical protein
MMLKLGFIAVLLVTVGLVTWFASPNRARSDRHNSILGNLRQLNNAKEQWRLDQKPSVVSWPSRADIMQYLGPRGATTFDQCVPPLDGEIYVINRADRPVAVYLTKDSFGFREGQLLTIEDIQTK